MNQERLLKVLLRPIVSEKSNRMTELNQQYAFRVLSDATKLEISQAVENLFAVDVENVQVVNVKGKKKRFGGRLGQRSNWRKAYVRVKSGQSIDFGGAA
ncbi:50S ribosomal protein L23 [Rhodoferax sp. 4810]|uniref:Large ribosomal subunit protein uL23 n=1 Tax=Thiospirillum jenense TaxID=1653858 RepID=A0A839HEW8_9GAMM|nr:50S ribosomal protein L23 [Thiospirillum jenense]MBB1073024.1 50S ribosomal protein L23 [Rhodoferax jenense]MBB1124972.1 50S ribosomal protein L23 [Thiospirillum jenense]